VLVKALLPIVIVLVRALRAPLLSLLGYVLVDGRQDFEWIGCQIGRGAQRMFQHIA
jgi:hypothetical protein